MRTALDILPLTPDLNPAMLAASQTDGGHYAPLATHIFLRSGEVVGAAAICAPTITFWAHSKRLHARESLELCRRTTAKALELHDNFLCTCATASPFYPLMTRLGYRRIGNADFFEPVE